MKKIAFIICVILNFVSCKENTSQPLANLVNQEITIQETTFPKNAASCEKNQHLFGAIPHLDNIGDYNFKSVGCVGKAIMVNYDHPTNQFYEFHLSIKELGENKAMLQYVKLGYNTASKYKVNGNDISDLNIFDNASFRTKQEPEYFDVSYSASYKDKYIIKIIIGGKNLSNKEQIDSFLKKYLEPFKKDSLI